MTKIKNDKENPMREVIIEKVILSCAGIEDKLQRSKKLLNKITGKTVKVVASRKRIPAFNVRPGLETGCLVTIRGKEKEELLKRLFAAKENKIKRSQLEKNHFSFGIPEYLEIAGMEYQRDIGILGLNVTVAFKRKGKRVGIRKVKRAKVPEKQNVSKEEIEAYLVNKFKVEVE